LTFAVFVVVSPYFVYQAISVQRNNIGSLGPASRPSADFVQRRRRRIDLDPRRVGRRGVDGARARRRLKARYPRLRLFLSTTHDSTGQHVARRSLKDVDEVFYFPFDWAFHRPPGR